MVDLLYLQVTQYCKKTKPIHHRELILYLSIYISVYLSVCLYVYPSIYLSICLSVCMSMYLYIYLSVCLSVCLSVYPSICVFFFLSIYFKLVSLPLRSSSRNPVQFRKQDVDSYEQSFLRHTSFLQEHVRTEEVGNIINNYYYIIVIIGCKFSTNYNYN